MLGKCEKMAPTTTSNKWTQVEIDDHKVSMGSSGRVMEKPSQDLLQQQHQALKCPRCDSSNTKFCYYNNYSLSQPRHFCKACKRYWTRGGTLRNVPVGGGCRKNKRVKRPNLVDASNSPPIPSSSSSTPSSISNPPSKSHIDNITSSSAPNHVININPLLYGLPGNGNGNDFMSLSFPRFNFQPQLNGVGLGYSSGVIMSGDNNGFSASSNNNGFLSAYNSIFGSCSSSTSTPVMASLLSSTLLQRGGVKGSDQVSNGFQGLLGPLEELQMEGNSGGAGVMTSKEVKVEGQNRLEWNNNNNSTSGGGGVCENQMDHVGLSDPNSLYWATWSDQPNIGPSVTSLI